MYLRVENEVAKRERNDKMITLTTDFGLSEGYVGAMKGRIYSLLKKYNKGCEVVDISHEIEPFNIWHGAYVLKTSIPYFPKAIHIAVVDPTVGSERRSIVVETENFFLVGPDNGLFTYLIEDFKVKNIYKIDESQYCPSKTFHGRDVYAVVGAEIFINDFKFEGERIKEIVKLDYKNRVIHIDRFGNIILGIRDFNLRPGDEVEIVFNGEKKIVAKFVESYYQGKEGFICLRNSEGFLEVAKFMDSANKYLNVKHGDRVEVSL
ncbi:SAM hydrolase/SAM-dependent halogenase family protein [Methanocaldococcus infernus]